MGHEPVGNANRLALKSWRRALELKGLVETGPHQTLLSFIMASSQFHADRPALSDETRQLSYRDLIDLAGFYARWNLESGPDRGETVAVMMANSAAYAAIWLGITHAGGLAALINSNLRGAVLAHAIRVSRARHVIVDVSTQAAVAEITLDGPWDLQIWVHDTVTGGLRGISAVTPGFANLTEPAAHPGRRDPALLIYTSGTTGMPKAAYVRHGRILEWSAWFAGMTDAQPTDRLFNCLPMYHSTGGVVAIGAMLAVGGSVVVRRRFSATRFWDDFVGDDCTIFQYIGELCRYLVRSPSHPLETTHRLRLCCGNGLHGDIWEAFQARFRVPRILEFYAATEGNVSLYNCEGKPGAIGRVPPFLAASYPIELIQIDVETGSPIRGPDGFCLRSRQNEAGEAISPIRNDSGAAARQFDGYTDAGATDRKILQDVFERGDRWFRSGDLLRRDASGFFYFVDRIGDTFRWKGENVSTQEVASVVSTCAGITDAVVYGIAVPGTEGRAGMAAITVNDHFSLADLRRHLIALLPDYARPLFVRICNRLETTSTFKLTKSHLVRDGLAPSDGDAVWFNDARRQSFVKLDQTLKKQIGSGDLKI